MAPVPLVEHRIASRVPKLGDAATCVDAEVSIRVDPLTGSTARILDAERLSPRSRPDLSGLATAPGFCPFCESVIEKATGTFDSSITSEGRIRRGVSAVVPNVIAYSEFSAVGLYDTTRHFLDLDEFTPRIVGDLLTGHVDFARRIHALRPKWHSINSSYLPPAGSSLIHPHAQSAHDEVGTTVQRRLVEASRAWTPGSFWRELVQQEAGGPRWFGTRGRVSVLTPWSPIGFHEVWAVMPEVHDVVELTDEDCADLGAVISGVFAGYLASDLTSFNWAMYGGGPAASDTYAVLLRVVSRANPEPMYRSDVTYFERLHFEAMIDVSPERVAERLRPHVRHRLDD